MKIIINEKAEEKTYEEICRLLHVLPETHFVEINNAGTVDFTTGKPDEVNYLIDKIDSAGMKMSSKFRKWAKKNNFII